MTPSKRKTFLNVVQVWDIALLFLAFGVSCSITARRSVFYLFNSLETKHPIQVFSATLLLATAWHLSLRINGLYKSHRLDGYRKEILDICSGILPCTVFAAMWLWFVSSPSKHEISYIATVSALFGATFAMCFVVTRSTGRALMHSLRMRGYNLRSVLIIGTNRRADGLAKDIELHSEWGYSVQGFIDEKWWYEPTSQGDERKLLGGFDAFPELLRTLPVDEIFVSLPIASFYKQVASIVALCRQHGIVVRSIGTLFDHDPSKRSVFLRGNVGTITLYDDSWSEWGTLAKRAVDFIVSFTMLLLLAPAFLVIAALIKLTSPGPIFFVQTRLGLGKRPFQILKFRTMVQNAEKLMTKIEHLNETQGPTFKAKNDPRIVPLGKLLRKTSLDEIPQLINVLVGEMSLVGPRPLPLRDYQGFSEDWHRRRFSVKPGITCLWQITGRSSIGFDEWMVLDMRYIDQWSVWLDIKILFQTIPAVFRGSGAV
jgi:exopolysaccharide biosynthesis polyprenyl glycosylphosphotransferase